MSITVYKPAERIKIFLSLIMYPCCKNTCVYADHINALNFINHNLDEKELVNVSIRRYNKNQTARTHYKPNMLTHCMAGSTVTFYIYVTYNRCI